MKNALLLAAALEGFLLLSLEIICAQMLQPFYGNSHFVWLYMIAITMLGSALGYFVGGFISKKPDNWILNFLSVNLILLTIYILNIHQLSEFLFPKFIEMPLLNSMGIHSTALLLLPVSAITLVNPILIKYRNREDQSGGKSSGLVFFISTLGGITSIYTIAFLILPHFDLFDVLIAFGWLIAVISLIFQSLHKRFKWSLVSVVIYTLLFFAIQGYDGIPEASGDVEVLHREHGIMGEVEVRDNNQLRYLLVNRSAQSAVRKETLLSYWTYPYRTASYASLLPAGSNVLVAGLGGGVLINMLIGLEFNVDVVEIDTRVYDLSKEYMGMLTDFNLIEDDIRHFINVTKKKYDLVILDLSKGETIPPHVYTAEAFDKTLSVLNPGGFILLHFFSYSYRGGDIGLQSIMKTLDHIGASFATIKKHPDDSSPEQLLVASLHSEIVPPGPFRMPVETMAELKFPIQNFMRKDPFDDGVVLYDRKNNIELMQFDMVEEMRNELRLTEHNIFYRQ